MRFFLPCIAGLSLLFTLGCSSSKTFSNSSNWLPSDFKPENGILLIDKVSWPKSQQAKMEKYMKENYTFKYEFVSLSAGYTEKYSDVNVYRFVIENSNSSHVMHQSDPTVPASQKITVNMVDFNFYDRLTKKTFPATGKGSSYAFMTFRAMMNTILQKE